MPKHRAPRVSTLRWSAFLGACALLVGGIVVLVTNSTASAHCRPAWSNCHDHGPSATTTTTSTTTQTTQTTQTTSATTHLPVPVPTYTPPANGGTGSASTSSNNSQETSDGPPGQLPARPTQTTPDQSQDTDLAPAAPPTDGGTGGGGGTTGGTAGESVPIAEPAPDDLTQPPAQATEPGSAPAPAQSPAVTTAPGTAIDPVLVSAQCLLGTNDSGGCAGADTARDLAPAGLLVLGALALLGSGSFLESLRGSLRS